jgi:hypothetical protein
MNTPVSRSTFVTVLGWILVILTALNLCSAVMQTIAFSYISSAPELSELGSAGAAIGSAFQGIGLAFILLTAFMTYAAWSLLQRRNWARVTFVVLFAISFGLNILWILVALGAGSFIGSLVGNSELAQLGTAAQGVFVMLAVFAAVGAALSGWLVKRLRSKSVKLEFGAVQA